MNALKAIAARARRCWPAWRRRATISSRRRLKLPPRSRKHSGCWPPSPAAGLRGCPVQVRRASACSRRLQRRSLPLARLPASVPSGGHARAGSAALHLRRGLRLPIKPVKPPVAWAHIAARLLNHLGWRHSRIYQNLSRRRAVVADLDRDNKSHEPRKVPSGMWLELVWRALRSYEGIVSGGEVNRRIDWFGGERLPAVDLAHVDLTGCKQRPEQHGGGVC
jgi:hypothetical protein